MSELTVTGSSLGTSLQRLLMSDQIEPGSEPSYQLCKETFIFHPLGRKMVEAPINVAMSQTREIAIQGLAGERAKKQFEDEWKALGVDKIIFNVKRQSRIYGVSSVVCGSVGTPTDRPINPKSLPNVDIYFNVLDPLNTAGSLVLNQDPNSPDFQKAVAITVSGQAYHPSRSCVMLNEEPIYIAYSNSAFGYVGRSVYQRALFPMKSFVQSMITDDMVTRKAGLLVAIMKAAGSVTDRLMQGIAGVKRSLLKEAQTGNVISISEGESIETLNMNNTDTAMTTARKNILENCAAADDMPAIMLNSETFAQGLAEGTEDAKRVSQCGDRIRKEMQPLYDFFDNIVMHKAWSPAFYETLLADYPELKKLGFAGAFYQWKNSYTAEWPSLLEEPPSEKVKVDDVKLKAIIAMLEVMLPEVDPENKAILFQWAADNFNELSLLFQSPLNLDIQALAAFKPPVAPTAEEEPEAPAPFAKAA